MPRQRKNKKNKGRQPNIGKGLVIPNQELVEEDLDNLLSALKADLQILHTQLKQIDSEIGVLISRVKLKEFQSFIAEINCKTESLSFSLMLKALYIKLITLNYFVFFGAKDDQKNNSQLVHRSVFNFDLVYSKKCKFLLDEEIDVISNALSSYYCSLFVASVTYSLMSLFINQRSSLVLALTETTMVSGLMSYLSTWRGKTRLLYLHCISILIRNKNSIPDISTELSYFCCVLILAASQFLISFRNIYLVKWKYENAIVTSKKLREFFGNGLSVSQKIGLPTSLEDIIKQLFTLYQDKDNVNKSIDKLNQKINETYLKLHEKQKINVSKQFIQDLIAQEEKDTPGSHKTKSNKKTVSKEIIKKLSEINDDNCSESKQDDALFKSKSCHTQSFSSWIPDGQINDNQLQHIDDQICQLCEELRHILPMGAYRTGSSVSANKSEVYRDVDYLLIFSEQESLLEKRNQIRVKMKDLFSDTSVDEDDVSQEKLRLIWPQYENNLIRVSEEEESVFVYKWEFKYRDLSVDVTMRSSLNFQPPISTVRVLSLADDQEVGRFSPYPSNQLHILLSRCQTDRDWLIAIKKIHLEFLKRGVFFVQEKWSLGARSCLSDILLATAKLSKGLDQDGVISYVKAFNSAFIQVGFSDVWVDDGITLANALMHCSDLIMLGKARTMFNHPMREKAREYVTDLANSGFKYSPG